MSAPDQASGLRDLANTSPTRVIAVAAGKGGVGKSSVSINLALALAKTQRVMLFDADMGLANVDILLGLNHQYNLSHVIERQCELADIIINGPNGLKIIPSASGIEKMVQLGANDTAGIIHAFGETTKDLDVLLIDTAAGIDQQVTTFSRAAQEVLVVVCDEPTSLTDAYALIKVLSRHHGVERFHIIANMVNTATEGRDLFAKLCQVTDHFLNVCLDYLGAVPYDELVKKSIKQQKSVLAAYPSAKSSKAFLQIAEKINQWSTLSDISGNQAFFLENLVEIQQRGC